MGCVGSSCDALFDVGYEGSLWVVVVQGMLWWLMVGGSGSMYICVGCDGFCGIQMLSMWEMMAKCRMSLLMLGYDGSVSIWWFIEGRADSCGDPLFRCCGFLQDVVAQCGM
jgi:hypothetical protein